MSPHEAQGSDFGFDSKTCQVMWGWGEWEPSRKVPLPSVREAGVAARGAAVPRGQLAGEVERGGGGEAARVRGGGMLGSGML